MEPSLLGRKIRERRKELGLTIEGLAKRIGVSRQYLAKIERHGRIPSKKLYEDIEKILSLPSGYRIYLNAKTPLKGGLDIEPKATSSQKQVLHRLVVNQIKGLIKEKNWRPGMPLSYLTKPKEDIAFCKELIAHFMPAEKGNKKLIRKLTDAMKKLRIERDNFQKRFWKAEKIIFDLIKPE